MTDSKTKTEVDCKSSETGPKPKTQQASKGPFKRFVRKFFGRNEPEPKKSDPNIYPLY